MIPYAVISMNADVLCAYKEVGGESQFSGLFCICCITMQARNTQLLREQITSQRDSSQGFQTKNLVTLFPFFQYYHQLQTSC